MRLQMHQQPLGIVKSIRQGDTAFVIQFSRHRPQPAEKSSSRKKISEWQGRGSVRSDLIVLLPPPSHRP